MVTLYNRLYVTATDVPGVMTATGMNRILSPSHKAGGSTGSAITTDYTGAMRMSLGFIMPSPRCLTCGPAART
jgi:hypothetical protein